MNYVILCGGSGSRLWPLSREKLPKQLLPIVNANTMLQNTVLRCKNLEMVNKITVICNIEHAFLVEKQLKGLTTIPVYIVTEPIGRDTAAAVAIASLLSDPLEKTLIVPCDHVFDDTAFVSTIKCGLEQEGTTIVTFGINAAHPETGYGYIETDLATMKTLQFVEKPNYDTAMRYIESGNFFWNAGVFLFQNRAMISCFEQYAPDILDACRKSLNLCAGEYTKPMNIALPRDIFSQCRAISVDYAIMEKLCNDSCATVGKMTIPYKGTWCDIGSFYALHEFLLDGFPDKNVIKGDVITYDTTNCYIESDKSLVTVVGLENMVIVNTRDALLVCHKDKTQDVKKIVDILKEQKREERIIHSTAFRPWGWYCNIEGNDHSGFKVKRIAVYPGKKLSLQSHDNRSEHWVIVKGTAKVQVGHDFLTLSVNQHVYIPKKTLHRMENIGEDLLEFVETQIGSYLGEDDIIRYEDDFGRV